MGVTAIKWEFARKFFYSSHLLSVSYYGSYFSYCCDLASSNLREGGRPSLGLQFEGLQSTAVGVSLDAGPSGSCHTASAVREQRAGQKRGHVL